MPLATEEQLVIEASSPSIASGPVWRTAEELVAIVSQFAATDGWMERVRLRTEGRWYERLHHSPEHDIWVISWLPGQSTGFHDHGESAGAFVVATGSLEEHRPGKATVAIPPGQPRSFGPDYAHDVRNVSLAPAISIHAYSPPLSEMNEYELDGSQLVPSERRSERVQSLAQHGQAQGLRPANRTSGLSVDQMLSESRARLRRLSPDQSYATIANTGAILVDIRPEAQRVIEGSIPGAWIVERNVLEWRLDPASSTRLPVATDHDVQVIVFCSEGYTSSLAAAALQELGLWRATDMVGGFQAWRAAGLPIVPPGTAS